MFIAPRHKVYLLVVCVLALMVWGAVPASASDLGGLNFTMAADPSTLTSPGTVNVTVRLANSGQTDILTPLSLYDADNNLVTSFFDGGSLAQLKVGETQTWQGTYAVTQAQLDAGKIIFTVKAAVVDTQGNVANVALPAEAVLTYTGEKIDLSISRTIDPEVVRKDAMVKVLYELVNNGNVRLVDIRVREHSSISTTTQTVASLEPGASAVVTFEKKASTTDLTSHPNITYKKDGDRETLRATLDTLTIPAARPNLKLSLTADQTAVSIGDKVTLTLDMQNTGNVSYSNVVVTDAALGEVFTNVDIPAGQTLTRAKEVTMLATATYRFNLALNDNTGVSQTEQTNEVKVSAYDPSQIVRMSLVLSSDRDAIDSVPGIIRFNVEVTNNSDFALENVKVFQGATQIYTIASLLPGQSMNINREYQVSQSGKFQFTATAVDAQDNTQTFTSNTLDIPFVPATPAPTMQTPVTVPPVITLSPVPVEIGGVTGSQGVNVLMILTWVAGILFAGSFVLFAISTAMRAKQRRQSESAYDHLALEPKRDFSDPDTYSDDKSEPAAEDSIKPAVPEMPLPETEMPHDKYLKQDLPAETVEQPSDDSPQPVTDEGGYRLTRDAEDAVPESEQRTRRSGKRRQG
ncbi:MAG: hypothetical protein PHQ85_02655 [Eubacteriales bacterium]|nr:hypothetical protein [Eubacteriales bacterium]MDD4105733.1 hypothetical protein [Eubacteriales bacterium]MDD4710955.1 hypothetical protein [Eubacteriales bacterium]NLO15470.1 hypothetical protein [Clostridiales bacterium]